MPDLDDLLLKTSRTFALSIPQLPEPTRREVTLAYLLFRIADTFEDAALWTGQQRLGALDRFGILLESPDAEDLGALRSAWTDDPPINHAGYRELLGEIPFVLSAFQGLRDSARDIIRRHLLKTVRGMADFIARDPDGGRVELHHLQDLRDYCYVVAGLVGEMLTALFVLGRESLESIDIDLRSRARAFGEGLQLVNILKDSADDAGEGRLFLPSDVDRAEVFDLGRADLDQAQEYVSLLHQAAAPLGLVRFCAVPVLLARATLDRVETKGPGAKLTRPEVFALVDRMEAALAEGLPPIP